MYGLCFKEDEFKNATSLRGLLLERVFTMNFQQENVDKLLDLTNQLVNYLNPSVVQSNEFSVHLTH